eukprot:GHVO01062905.1.p2 GENE.GHVO01062905.1~~GHVO01062905.1.p2  ORF type:complete len:121 (+),score=29.97 GHVO01062905.1:39-401(+)
MRRQASGTAPPTRGVSQKNEGLRRTVYNGGGMRQTLCGGVGRPARTVSLGRYSGPGVPLPSEQPPPRQPSPVTYFTIHGGETLPVLLPPRAVPYPPANRRPQPPPRSSLHAHRSSRSPSL